MQDFTSPWGSQWLVRVQNSSTLLAVWIVAVFVTLLQELFEQRLGVLQVCRIKIPVPPHQAQTRASLRDRTRALSLAGV